MDRVAITLQIPATTSQRQRERSSDTRFSHYVLMFCCEYELDELEGDVRRDETQTRDEATHVRDERQCERVRHRHLQTNAVVTSHISNGFNQ